MSDFERDLLTNNYLTSLAATQHGIASEVPQKDYELQIDVLDEIIVEITNSAKCRDAWLPVTVFEKPSGTAYASRRTKQTGFQVELRIDLEGVRLSYGLANANRIPFVSNAFWTGIIGLVEDHGAKYEMTSRPGRFGEDPKDRELSRRRKSAVFAMIADFILTLKVSEEAHPSGDFTFRYGYKGKWRNLLSEITTVVSKGWALDYMLYCSYSARTRRFLERL